MEMKKHQKETVLIVIILLISCSSLTELSFQNLPGRWKYRLTGRC